jgi:hypothetical protein
MLDTSTFGEQYPEPNRDDVLRMIEQMKAIVVEHFKLRTQAAGTQLQPVSTCIDANYVAAYMNAWVNVHENVIPGIQKLLPKQFEELIHTEFCNWIPAPKIQKPPS